MSSPLSFDYVFGFGSIMDTSTHATWQTSTSTPMLGSVATISERFGYRREWNFRSSTGFTALGISKTNRAGECCDINGVLFQVPTDEMANFDRREAGYMRVSIPLDMMTFYPDTTGSHSQTDFQLTDSDRIWIYIPLESHTMYADDNHPLLQSYVDTVLRGCLEWGGELFAEQFILTTGGWSCHFLNDTPSSRRPWLHRKEYDKIDALLKKHSQKTHVGDRRHPEEFAARFNQRMRGTWSIPRRNPNFTGRDQELSLLHSQFVSQDLGRKAVIKIQVCGMGGVGKSQLATEYCYRSFPTEYGLVIWINAETSDSMAADFRQLLADFLVSDNHDSMDMTGMDKTTEDVVCEVKTRLFRSNIPWLLVFDNLEDIHLLERFLPHGAGAKGHVLITTRHVDVESGSEHSGSLILGCFTAKESLELLKRSAGSSNIEAPEDELAAKELSHRLGHLPLALGMAAAYMRKCDVGVSEYLERYSDQTLLHGRLNDYALSVISSLSLSLKEVDRQAPIASEVLKLLSFLGPDQITKHLIRQLLRAKNLYEEFRHKQFTRQRIAHQAALLCAIAGGCAILFARRGNAKAISMLSVASLPSLIFIPHLISSTVTGKNGISSLKKVPSTISFSSSEYEQADTAWNVLKSFSLISVKEGKANMHRLLQQSMRSCQAEPECKHNITIVIDALASSWSFQATNTDSWKESLCLLEHVKAAVSHCTDYALDTGHIMQAAQLSTDSAVFSALTLNAFTDAKASLEYSLILYESTKLKTVELHKKRAEALLQLGRIFRYQSLYGDSKSSLTEALAIFQHLNQRDIDTQNGVASTQHELGLLELKQHNLKDAEEHLIKSLQLRREMPNQDTNSDCAATLHQLAAVHVSRKPPSLDKAKSLLLEALSLSSQIGQRAATLKQLARVSIRQGYLDLAESYLEQALELYSELYDNKSHMNIAAVQFQRGALALQQDRLDDAHLYFIEALRIRRHVYAYARSSKDSHPVHLEVACVFHELGCVGFAQRSYSQSKEMFDSEKEILIKLEETSPNDRIKQARITNLTWLRKCAKGLGDEDEATSLSKERAVLKRQRCHGNTASKHQSTIPLAIEHEAMQCRLLARKFALEKHSASNIRDDLDASLCRLRDEIDSSSDLTMKQAATEFRSHILAQINHSNAKDRKSLILHSCDVLRDALRARGVKVNDSIVARKSK